LGLCERQDIAEACDVKDLLHFGSGVLDDHGTLLVHHLLCRKQNAEARRRNVGEFREIEHKVLDAIELSLDLVAEFGRGKRIKATFGFGVKKKKPAKAAGGGK